MALRNIIPPDNSYQNLSPVFGMPSTSQQWQAHAIMLQKLHKIRGIGYWQKSLTTGDVYWSDMVYDFLGVESSRLIHDQEDFVKLVHPHDRKKVINAWQELEKTGFTDIKYRIIQPNGDTLWLHEIADNSAPDDPGILLSTLQDITDHKALEKKLKKEAITDDLTGTFNRGHFIKRLRQAFSHYLRSGQNAAVLLFDVDHFKSVNDTYGHVVGDKVLQQVCQLFKERFRETDVVGRLGGEEFAVLLFEVTPDAALAIAEEIRKMLAKKAFTTDADATFNISVTCGVAHFTEDDPTEESILRRADQSLYRGKHNGRNQVVGESNLS
ncbi:sensor domain-containing diguanylate cyclase [Halomonas janggokensis]|uniref:diguanylate cyclase n=1 Tax=Vreelandella janggokensis TaxID=370767 RepID=A0ABT4IS93_9GAMM|nr:sensor domain-containing diguanylate cyclase [Halomonas janggokensis]MCZ0925867.1 sensor domain-containing diguanylate cyclase [Halomonas janggokensis]MCZ0930934.1 sensor domain-containing diguanylate cyclase [Halomonas janggokensis]